MKASVGDPNLARFGKTDASCSDAEPGRKRSSVLVGRRRRDQRTTRPEDGKAVLRALMVTTFTAGITAGGV